MRDDKNQPKQPQPVEHPSEPFFGGRDEDKNQPVDKRPGETDEQARERAEREAVERAEREQAAREGKTDKRDDNK